jgi:dipeptidyl aminopeptidase/acylaminoacyl peptidase
LTGHVRAESVPAEDFARRPAIDSVAVSPSGKRLAVLMFGPSGYRRLGVMDLDPLGQPRVVGEFNDADVTSAYWVNDDRLVYEAFQPTSAEVRLGGAGTFAVNHDGTAARQLISWRWVTADSTGTQIQSRILPYGWFLHSLPHDDSSDIFVYKEVNDHLRDIKEYQLARLNTLTGHLQSLSLGTPEGTWSWLLDAAREPRLITAYKAGRSKFFWRSGKDAAWQEVADFDPLVDDIRPLHIASDGKVLVSAHLKNDKAAIYTFDPATRKFDTEPVLGVSGFDVNAWPQDDSHTGNLVGLHFVADRPMTYWFDAKLQRIQRALDAALPERRNQIFCGRCESTRFLVIRSRSDRQPGEYFLFDREKNSLQPIGASRPWIKESTQGRRMLQRFLARDGLEIPVYITHPPEEAADKPLPAVVLVHGGPYVRGANLTWAADAQFLASRGYRVIEPEYRGSTGYGDKLFRAGWKQWGRAMQDDLADAVKWAAGQGLIDPGKVCIMGANYGGYAALMGPIAHPGTYRCAVSYAGVTDVKLMYELIHSDITETQKKYSMPLLIGDPVADAALLPTISPLHRVAEIKVPVLLAHGWADRRVPYTHAQEFIAAAKKAGVPIEPVDYKEEAHGFFRWEDHADYYRRVEKFLEKALRAPQP